MSEKVVAHCDCGKAYRLPATYGGKHIRCKECGDAFLVPKLEDSLEASGLEEDLDEEESEVVEPPKRKGTGKLDRKKLEEGKSGRGREKSAEGKGEKPTSSARGRAKSDKAERDTGGKRRGTDASGKAGKRRSADGADDDGGSKGMKGKKGKTDANERPGSGKRPGRDKDKDKDKAGKRGPAGKRRRGEGDDGADKAKAKNQQQMMMIGGGVGLLLVIVLVVALMGGGGPPPMTANQKSILRDISDALVKFEQSRSEGSFSNALNHLDFAVKNLEVVMTPAHDRPAPVLESNPDFSEIPNRIAAAQKHKAKLEELLNAVNGINDGKVDGLMKYASDSDLAIRRAGVFICEQVIIKKGKENASEELKVLAKLAQESDVNIQQKAEAALIRFNTVEAIPFLLKRLELGSATQAYSDAMLRLTQHSEPEALEALHKALDILKPKESKEDLADAAKIVANLQKIANKSSVIKLKALKSRSPDALHEEIDDAIKKIEGS